MSRKNYRKQESKRQRKHVFAALFLLALLAVLAHHEIRLADRSLDVMLTAFGEFLCGRFFLGGE